MSKDDILIKLNQFDGDIDALNINFRARLAVEGGAEVSEIMSDLTGGYKMFMLKADGVTNRTSMRLAQNTFDMELNEGIAYAGEGCKIYFREQQCLNQSVISMGRFIGKYKNHSSFITWSCSARPLTTNSVLA